MSTFPFRLLSRFVVGKVNKHQLMRRITENEAIRFCSYPWIMYKHSADRKRYDGSIFPEKVRKLKGIHDGERCFIVGNGPSLNLEQLEALNREKNICFGMNHVYDLFDKTEWRPDYYFCFDRDFIRAEYDVITNLDAGKVFVEFSKAPKDKIIDNEKLVYYFTDYVFAIDRGTVVTDHVCTELDKHASFVTNTTHLCIEFAIYMGFKSIYLVGMDHDYSFGYGKNHAEGISEGRHNEIGADHICDLDVAKQKYVQYKQYADNNGIEIINASKGGKLDVFKRCDFYEALRNSK